MNKDTVSQLLTHLRNAAMAKQEKTLVPASKLAERILALLKTEGLVGSYTLEEADYQYSVAVPVRSLPFRQVSKPGARRYAGWRELKTVARGGLLIVSTPQGVMSGSAAIKRKLGGEVIARIRKEDV